jgi:hypothetical protein
VDDAVDMIVKTVGLPQFATSEESQRQLDDLVLAAQVRSAVVSKWPHVDVSAEDGIVVVHARAPLRQEEMITREITEIAETVRGVREVRVGLRPRF